MSDATLPVPSESTPALSQIERLADTFVAPSKTFADIRRSASWWLPWLLAALVGFGFIQAVQHQIGWNQVYENTINQNPVMAKRLANAPAAQQAQSRHFTVLSYKYGSYAGPILNLLFAAIAAGILLATVNFGFGGKATFGQMYAVWFYATLPLVVAYILAIITLYAGLDPSTFNLKNPVGTNLAYYTTGSIPAWLTPLFSALDVFKIWTAVLLTIGCAKVAQIKKSSAAVAVFGWWILIILASTAIAGVTGA
jgi:hypothetical protein